MEFTQFTQKTQYETGRDCPYVAQYLNQRDILEYKEPSTQTKRINNNNTKKQTDSPKFINQYFETLRKESNKISR